jgi:chemotaxis protein MotB
MAKSSKKKSGGAPDWMVTYGDMVTLLLTFFVMLVSIANFEVSDDKFTAAVQSIQEALGMRGQTGAHLDPSVDFHSLLQKLESIIPPDKPRKQGDSEEEGIYGEEFRVRNIRDGREITLGGPLLFEPFSDNLTPDGQKTLEQMDVYLRGHRNKIEVRGHAADQPRPADWTYQDAWQLSYARAVRVAEALVGQGVDEKTIRIVAAGDSEPVTAQAYDPEELGNNRRVEIIVRESLVDDYARPPSTTPASDPSTIPTAPAADTRDSQSATSAQARGSATKNE